MICEGDDCMEQKDRGGFFLCLLWNALLYAAWSLPAWILLVLHAAIGLPIVWFWAALGVWALLILLRTLLIVFARYASAHRIPVPENKNPYSKTVRDPYAGMRNQ